MKTVMLIDDSEADLLYSQIIVSRSGVCERVLPFDTAAQALAYLANAEASDIDLILLDINMPGLNGFQFLRAYDALPAAAGGTRAAVVMLTSSPDPHDRGEAALFDCVRGYIVKPISLEAARSLETLLQASPAPGG